MYKDFFLCARAFVKKVYLKQIIYGSIFLSMLKRQNFRYQGYLQVKVNLLNRNLPAKKKFFRNRIRHFLSQRTYGSSLNILYLAFDSFLLNKSYLHLIPYVQKRNKGAGFGVDLVVGPPSLPILLQLFRDRAFLSAYQSLRFYRHRPDIVHSLKKVAGPSVSEVCFIINN